jgi:hypothetical protein
MFWLLVELLILGLVIPLEMAVIVLHSYTTEDVILQNPSSYRLGPEEHRKPSNNI